MVFKAICGEKGLLDVQTHRWFDKSCKDIPLGFVEVLPEDNVQWVEKCNERGMKFTTLTLTLTITERSHRKHRKD